MTTETSQAELHGQKWRTENKLTENYKWKVRIKTMNDNRIIQGTQEKWEQNKTDWEKDRNNAKDQKL
jgi:hypothetical protein